jgi:hypothetical protein
MTTATKTEAQKSAEAALAAIYAKAAKSIAQGVSKMEQAIGGTWEGFKAAVTIGLDAGQTDETAFKGLKLACDAADVPKGTWNRYSPMARKVYKAIAAGELSREEALAMSVKDVEKKWPRKANVRTATAATTAATGGTSEGNEPASGGAADMLEGDSERGRLLSQINGLISAMSEDDLTALLDVLESWGEPTKQREAA